MTNNPLAFAAAEFARHANGRKAMRREDVSTKEPWVYLTGNAINRLSDYEMAADGGWTIVQATSDPVPVPMIREPYDLEMFRKRYEMRYDWHEPDEQGIGARIIGTHLDNAMGSTTRHEGKEYSEFNIVLTMEMGATETRDVAVVNLATLLSWAARYGKAQR